MAHSRPDLSPFLLRSRLSRVSAAAFLAAMLVLPVPGHGQAPIVPDSPMMRLDEIGLYSVGYRYRGQIERRMPVGWSGYFDEKTGIACQPAGEQNGRHAFLLHCPWRGGTGITFQQFSFRLPRARRILLRGATGMRADIVGQSDGAMFRVLVNGKVRLETNRTDAAWKPFEIDLTSLAGSTADIRFETDPGPKDNPSFDFSLWGDRELVIDGYRPVIHSRPDPPPLSMSALSRPTGDVAPPSGYAGSRSIWLKGDAVVFRYAGAEGVLEYLWKRPGPMDDPLLGRITLRAQMRGDTPVEVPLATSSRAEWTAAVTPVESHWTRVSGGYMCVRTFRIAGQEAKLQITGRLVGKSLALSLSCDRPVISQLDVGDWGPVVRRRNIPVPYYSGQIHYLPRENLFTNSILDWTVSSASAHEGSRARYAPLTDGSLRTLNERVVFTAAWHLPEVLPGIPNAPSPYLRKLAGRIVLDIWGGQFEDIARAFDTLSDYGIVDCVALIHDWQRSGYDNALPAHVPANPSYGGEPAMRDLVASGKRKGTLVALHENYVDYYPNYEGFRESDIALAPSGTRIPAWFNPGTKIQSFAVKPNSILPLARTQSPEIHRRYGTNADYLDVHSAVPPWFHVDARSGEKGAGTFRRVWDVHRQLWQYERQTHGGPVFGEGANHWYWSGCLDGVEAQFGVGWPANQGVSAPLMVDFDLLRIHPLQLNHGMGYYERWWNNPTWGAIPPMRVLDQYRMQEVAYGHAGFLGGSTWNVLPLAWLEHHLLAPVTDRYGAARVTEIAYQVGGVWRDSTAAAKAGSWDRVRIRYDNGLTVTANNSSATLAIDGLSLPQFGWSARGAGVTAWTALSGGVVADYAETAHSVFANARNASYWNLAGAKRIRPTVQQFRQTGPRTFQATYRWLVNERLDQDYQCFVHFTGGAPEPAGEAIRFQQDHALTRPASRWTAGTQVDDGPYTISVPNTVPDGDYGWTIGLFTPSAGRLNLEGKADGHARVRLGTLHIHGNTVSFEAERPQETRQRADNYLNANGKVIDFGILHTNGSVNLRREGNEWALQTLPRNESFVVELSAAKFGRPASVRSQGGAQAAVRPVGQGRMWRLPLNGAREYRWAAKGKSP